MPTRARVRRAAAVAALKRMIAERPDDLLRSMERAVEAAADIYVLDVQLSSPTIGASQKRLVTAAVMLRAAQAAVGRPGLPPEGR